MRVRKDDYNTPYSRNLEGEMPIRWANFPGNNRRPYFKKRWRIVILVDLINRHTPHLYGRWKHTKSLQSTRSTLINIDNAGMRKEVVRFVLEGSPNPKEKDCEKAHAVNIRPRAR